MQPHRVQRTLLEQAGKITVESSADACELTADKAPSGNVSFKVKNTGDEVTEFYLYAEDGMRIIGEIENVGPGSPVTSWFVPPLAPT